jgi:hypothetical protein
MAHNYNPPISSAVSQYRLAKEIGVPARRVNEIVHGQRVARLADDVDAGVGEQPGDALAGEHHVLGYDDAHGISARHAVCLMDRLPPSAPTRSASAIMGASRSVPLSSTVTTSRPRSWARVTAARSAPRRGRVVDGLRHGEVRRRLDRGRVVSVVRAADLDGQRGGVGRRRQRGA